MPLDAPGTTPDINLSQGDQRFPRVEKPDRVVVAAYGQDVLNKWMALDRGHARVEPVSTSVVLSGQEPGVVPFVDEERLRAALPNIPAFLLEVIPACRLGERRAR